MSWTRNRKFLLTMSLFYMVFFSVRQFLTLQVGCQTAKFVRSQVPKVHIGPLRTLHGPSPAPLPGTTFCLYPVPIRYVAALECCILRGRVPSIPIHCAPRRTLFQHRCPASGQLCQRTMLYSVLGQTWSLVKEMVFRYWVFFGLFGLIIIGKTEFWEIPRYAKVRTCCSGRHSQMRHRRGSYGDISMTKPHPTDQCAHGDKPMRSSSFFSPTFVTNTGSQLRLLSPPSVLPSPQPTESYPRET